MSMLFLKCERDAYAARFVRNGRQRAEMEWQVVTDAFDYLRTPRQTRDPDMVREMYEAVGEFEQLGHEPPVLTARAIFAAVVLDILGEERLRPEDTAYRPEAVKCAFAAAMKAGAAAFDAEVEADDPMRECLLGLAPGMKDRLGTQAFMAWREGMIAEAVRTFPYPAFGSERHPSKRLAFLPINGIATDELWNGLIRPERTENLWRFLQGAMDAATVPFEGSDAGWLVAEIVDRPAFGALHAFEPPLSAEGAQPVIVPLVIKGKETEDSDFVPIMAIPFLPRACPANVPNTAVKFWSWGPWRDGVAAEAWLSLDNGVTIYAIAPFYCHDKFFIRRGLPYSALVAFFAISARIDTIEGDHRMIDGTDVLMKSDLTFTVFASRDERLTRAWYTVRAMVAGVSRVRMWNGKAVLRLELRMRDMTFPVPTYVRSESIEGGTPQVGDAVLLTGWFFVDARQAQMTDEEYDRLYPDGLVVPEDRVPGNLEGGT